MKKKEFKYLLWDQFWISSEGYNQVFQPERGFCKSFRHWQRLPTDWCRWFHRESMNWKNGRQPCGCFDLRIRKETIQTNKQKRHVKIIIKKKTWPIKVLLDGTISRATVWTRVVEWLDNLVVAYDAKSSTGLNQWATFTLLLWLNDNRFCSQIFTISRLGHGQFA